MRKLVMLLSVLLIMMVVVSSVMAEDKVSTTINLRNDWVSPKDGEEYWRQWTTIHWQTGKIGFGVDLFTSPQNDYLGVMPYGTYNIVEKKLDVVGGVSSDSGGSDYAGAGIWYYPSVGPIDFFLDARNYWDISGGNTDYTDNFLSISSVVGEKWVVGLDLVYDYWWDSGDDYYMIGPSAGYKFSESIKASVRPTKSWGNGEESEDSIRLRVDVNF